MAERMEKKEGGEGRRREGEEDGGGGGGRREKGEEEKEEEKRAQGVGEGGREGEDKKGVPIRGEIFTSTSFMTGTGLKKWSPPTRSFLSTTLAISVMDSEELFEASIVWLQINK